MFSYEDLDDWQKNDRSHESEALVKAACEEAGEKYYGCIVRGPDDYRGLLDEVLPESPIALQADMSMGIPTGELNPLGANYCDYSDISVAIMTTEPTTLRDALADLEAACIAAFEKAGAEERHYYIEGMELSQGEGMPYLHMHLGT